MLVCLDPGHGHKNRRPTGARANGLVEDDWALFFAHRLGHYLRAKGARTCFTRADDQFIGLTARGTVAKANEADVFLSLHLNAAGSEAAHGCEAFVAAGDVKPKALATALLAQIGVRGIRSRGVKWDSQSQHASLTVLRSTYRSMKSVLLEIGFLSNACDARLLKDKKWCEMLAEDLARIITTHP